MVGRCSVWHYGVLFEAEQQGIHCGITEWCSEWYDGMERVVVWSGDLSGMVVLSVALWSGVQSCNAVFS